MNKPIARLFAVVLVMFAVLVGATSWWTVADAPSLNKDHPDQNRRALLRGLKIRRGAIRADDNTLIARSVRNSEGIYSRRYPEGLLFGHPVGYSYTSLTQTGLEASYNDQLAGRQTDASTLVDQVTGRAQGGDDLQTTLDPKAQRQAEQLIGSASPISGGSAVAIDPRTGEVKVMASVPGFDPNSLRRKGVYQRLAKDDEKTPLIDRSLQFGYAPGSTMKVVTLAAAIDSGKYELNSTVDGTNAVKVSGVPLNNDFQESFGSISLKDALTKSVNTAFAQVAVKLGRKTMRKYMERFGFDKKPQLDYPKGSMSAAGSYRNGKLLTASSRYVDLGRTGIGQGLLQVPALQMAQVASAVANGGKLMKPHLGDKLVDRDGRTSSSIDDEQQSRVMSKATARQVTEAMVSVVQSGTGTKAQIPGIQVAGKTGTAETEVGKDQLNKLWFICFAPANDPKIAMAVTVDDVRGFGGDVVAPIAKQLIQTLLSEDKG